MGLRRPQSTLTQFRGAIWTGLRFTSACLRTRTSVVRADRRLRTLMPVITPPVTVRNWLPSGNRRRRPSGRAEESGGGDPLVSGHVLLGPAGTPRARRPRDARVHDPILDVPPADEMATWLKAAAILHGSYAPHRLLLRVFIVVLLFFFFLSLSLSRSRRGNHVHFISSSIGSVEENW